MSYRKITVNDKQYEYVIGKTHTKIKGVGLYLNTQVGTEMVRTVFGVAKTTFVVTPATIRAIIAGEPTKQLHTCYHGTVTSKTMLDPYHNEVKDREVMIAACNHCLAEKRMNS